MFHKRGQRRRNLIGYRFELICPERPVDISSGADQGRSRGGKRSPSLLALRCCLGATVGCLVSRDLAAQEDSLVHALQTNAPAGQISSREVQPLRQIADLRWH